MNARTLEALKGSIKKWEKIVAGTGVDDGTANCPLCLLFNRDDTPEDKQCVGCPVMDKTKIQGCSGTPYEEWVYLFEGEYPYVIDDTEQEAKAKAELKFLKSLLP